MTRPRLYASLRALGVSTDVADATAEAMAGLSERGQRGVLLWLGGYTQAEAAREVGGDPRRIREALDKVRRKAPIEGGFPYVFFDWGHR